MWLCAETENRWFGCMEKLRPRRSPPRAGLKPEHFSGGCKRAKPCSCRILAPCRASGRVAMSCAFETGATTGGSFIAWMRIALSLPKSSARRPVKPLRRLSPTANGACGCTTKRAERITTGRSSKDGQENARSINDSRLSRRRCGGFSGTERGTGAIGRVARGSQQGRPPPPARAALSQKQLAAKLKSSQSRIAKIEAAAADVSLDLSFRALFAAGGRFTDLLAPRRKKRKTNAGRAAEPVLPSG